MPERLQLSRKRGFRLPEGARSVARPSKFGNMFKLKEAVARDDPRRATLERAVLNVTSLDVSGVAVLRAETNTVAAEAYGIWIRLPENWALREAVVSELRGIDLACYCPPGSACHVEGLLLVANDPDAGICRHCGHLIERCPRPQGNPLCKGWRHAGYDSQPVIGHCCEGRMINPAAEPMEDRDG
jgi:hypothetical protein